MARHCVMPKQQMFRPGIEMMYKATVDKGTLDNTRKASDQSVAQQVRRHRPLGGRGCDSSERCCLTSDITRKRHALKRKKATETLRSGRPPVKHKEAYCVDGRGRNSDPAPQLRTIRVYMGPAVEKGWRRPAKHTMLLCPTPVRRHGTVTAQAP